MYNMIKIDEKEVELEQRKLYLEYFLTEVKIYETKKEPNVFGVKIINKVVKDNEETYEVDTVLKISYSKEFVLKIINKLISNSITPVCLAEIIDDMITNDVMKEISV